jgi:hypothetical protein
MHIVLKRLIDNIKSRVNVYTPLVEGIVNSIQAIDESGRKDGKIVVTLTRSKQGVIKFESDALPDFTDVEIEDNGVGFNKINRDSFDTLYTELKIKKGGKGFGRFSFLKFFSDVCVESVYSENDRYYLRSFSFGKNDEIIGKDEKNNEVVSEKDTRTKLYLNKLDHGKFDKTIETIARKLLESLLIYFIRDNYVCPQIVIKDGLNGSSLTLNDLVTSEKGEIHLFKKDEFTLKKDTVEKKFSVKIFKIFYTRKHSSISLTADNREVVDEPLYGYVPEFIDDFYETYKNEKGENSTRNYTIKSYVLGDYLDENVCLERGGFEFAQDSQLCYPFSQQ